MERTTFVYGRRKLSLSFKPKALGFRLKKGKGPPYTRPA